MDFDTIAKNAARKAITRLGRTVTCRGTAGDVETVAVIEKGIALFGAEPYIGDAKWACSLLVEDVPSPQRGDRITDEHGGVWLLQEELPGTDQWVSEWSVTKR